MTLDQLSRAGVAFTAAVFGVLGVACAVAPERMAASVGLAASSGTAKAEVMAMYGGLELGIAAFLLHCMGRDLDLALRFVALSLGGLGALRLVGMLLHGGDWALLGFFLASELGGAALALVLLRQRGAGSRKASAV